MLSLADRKKIAQLILTSKDDELLNKVRDLLLGSGNSSKGYVKKYNDEINEAIKEIKGGKYMTMQEAEELLESWRKKE
jgi:hypothetical protein